MVESELASLWIFGSEESDEFFEFGRHLGVLGWSLWSILEFGLIQRVLNEKREEFERIGGTFGSVVMDDERRLQIQMFFSAPPEL